MPPQAAKCPSGHTESLALDLKTSLHTPHPARPSTSTFFGSLPAQPARPFSQDTKSRSIINRQQRSDRLHSTFLLNNFMNLIKDTCPVKFAFAQRSFPTAHQPSGPCSTYHEECGPTHVPYRDASSFRKTFQFAPFAYHFYCGVPQGRGFTGEEPACHIPYAKGKCPWTGFISTTLLCLFYRNDIRDAMVQRFGPKPFTSMQEYMLWVNVEENHSGKYYNGLELFIWYCLRIFGEPVVAAARAKL